MHKTQGDINPDLKHIHKQMFLFVIPVDLNVGFLFAEI